MQIYNYQQLTFGICMKAEFIFLLLHVTIFNYVIGAGTTDDILSRVDDDVEATIVSPCAPSSSNTEGETLLDLMIRIRRLIRTT